MRVLLVGDSPGALAAARELGQAGWMVGVASSSKLGYASMSRWSRRWHFVSPLVEEPDMFITEIDQIVAQFGYEVALGVGDAEVIHLSANRSRLGEVVPYAPHEQVRRAFDKLEITEVARDAGISTPETRIATTQSVWNFDLPIVVKARLHWDPDTLRKTSRVKAVIAHSRAEATEAVARMRAMGAESVFQEHIRGRVLHFVAVADKKHQIVTTVTHLTTRLGESEAGQSARAVTVPTDAQLKHRIQALLNELGWFGLVDLQFWLKEDGEAFLADFNGRIYGGLALPYASGMRPIDAWARLATEREVEVAHTHRRPLPGDGRRSQTRTFAAGCLGQDASGRCPRPLIPLCSSDIQRLRSAPGACLFSSTSFARQEEVDYDLNEPIS